ncbi:MAG: helix-hairpin-helix domain-containing protein, partial [Bacteroidota bacterium]
GRLATFDVGAYGARVYAFENDLRYLMTSRVFTGRGRRAYLLARWVRSRLTLEAKLAATWVQDADTIGSGLDETDGHRQRDIRIGARWMF